MADVVKDGTAVVWSLKNLGDIHQTAIETVAANYDVIGDPQETAFIERQPPEDIVVDITFVDNQLTFTINGRSLPPQAQQEHVLPFIALDSSNNRGALTFQQGTIRWR